MAKTRPASQTTVPKHSSRRTPRRSSRRSPWRAIVVALVVVGTIALAWRIVASRGGDATGGDGIEPVSTLSSPDVHSLLVDPTNPDHLFFGSHAGIQESQDGGFTWQDGSLNNTDAMSLAASAKDARTIYAAGHDVFTASHDGGLTWAPVQNNLPSTDIHGFAQDANDPKRLYAYVVGSGIMASADGGTTWQALPSQPLGSMSHVALATNTAGLYATTATGLALSRDQGTTWEPVKAQDNIGAITLATGPDDPLVLYAGTPNGLLKSVDGGKTWYSIGPSGEIVILAIAVAPSDPNRLVFVTQTGALYRSDYGGESWLSPK